MTAKELRALLKVEQLRKEDLALLLGIDPKKAAEWERGTQPISRDIAQQIHKALAEFREARARLKASGLWQKPEDPWATAPEKDFAESRGGTEDRRHEANAPPESSARAGESASTTGTPVREADARSHRRHRARGPLVALWSALRSAFL